MQKSQSPQSPLICQIKILLLCLSFIPFAAYAERQPFPQEFEVSDIDCARDVIVLDLENAINLALSYNGTLLNASGSVRSAELSEKLSQSEFDLKIIPRADTGYIGGGTAGSGLTVGGGVDFLKKLPSGTLITLSPALLKAADKYHSNFTARISQPLLNGFGRDYTLSGIRSAQFGYRTASRSFYKSINSTVLRTITLLYEVLKQEQLVNLNRECYERLEKFTKATKLKERVGLSDALDVYRAEIELKQAEDTLSQSYEVLQNTKDSLRDILALSQNTDIAVNVSLENFNEEWDIDEAIDIALRNRIELDQVADQASESRRLAKLSKKDLLLPDLNLVLDYSNVGYGEEFTGSFFRKRESRWGIGFTTSTDANRTLEKFSFQNSLIGVEAAERACAEIQNSVILEVKQTLRSVYRTREKIALQKQQIKNAEGEFKLAKVKFVREYANNFDVIQAEKALFAAQTNFITAVIDHKVGEYQLRAALGLLIEKP